MTQWDEEYWRRLALESQRKAENCYAAAMLNREFASASIARVWQNEAYQAHLKTLARLGLAAEERKTS